ncbi:MAG: hypothetical protein ACLP5V_05225 [Candidatus Bathyarchaeia archaeon]
MGKLERQNLDSVLLDAMDRTLTDMFGAEITQAIFSYLEDKYGIKKGTMVPHFDKLLLAFRETFGEGVLGLAVAKRFYAELGLRFNEQPTYVLHDYVKEAKSLLAKGKADH